MKARAVDSNAIIDLFNGVGRTLEWMDCAERIVIPSIVIGEVLAGIEPTKRGAETRGAFESLLSLPQVAVASVTKETARIYASVFRHLSERGRPIPDSDMWIAACALEAGATICTSDKHFDAIDSLSKVPAR